VNEVMNTIAFAALLYCCGGAICRLRHSRYDMRPVWIFIYVAIFAVSAWTAADLVTVGVDARTAITAVCVATYIRVTASAWADGVPSIARREL
jgi:hypothetical protein